MSNLTPGDAVTNIVKNILYSQTFVKSIDEDFIYLDDGGVFNKDFQCIDTETGELLAILVYPPIFQEKK
jgi:hypothetical protein